MRSVPWPHYCRSRGAGKILEGVTTEVIGHCGLFSLAPVLPGRAPILREYLAGFVPPTGARSRGTASPGKVGRIHASTGRSRACSAATRAIWACCRCCPKPCGRPSGHSPVGGPRTAARGVPGRRDGLRSSDHPRPGALSGSAPVPVRNFARSRERRCRRRTPGDTPARSRERCCATARPASHDRADRQQAAWSGTVGASLPEAAAGAHLQAADLLE